MNLKSFLGAAATGILIVASNVHAIMSPSPFLEIDQVAESVGQDLYRNWRLRLSEMPQNFQQVATSSGVQFRSPDHAGCSKKKKPSSTLLQPVGEVIFSSVMTAPDTLDERITYRGCNGAPLLIERLRVKGAVLTSSTIDDVLAGKRRFVRSSDETLRLTEFIDPTLGALITISSGIGQNGLNFTRISVMQKPLLTFSTRSVGPQTDSRIDLEDMNLSLMRFGSRLRSSSRGMKSSFHVTKRDDTLFYRLNNASEYTDQRAFEKAYSETVVFAIDATAVEILSLYLKQMPQTEAQKPAVGANQRILEELNLALNRVTSKTELDRVRSLLQELLKHIQDGTIVVDDRRPK